MTMMYATTPTRRGWRTNVSFLLLFIVAVLCPGLAWGSEAVDFAKHPTLSTPALSPDGKHIAVSLQNNDQDASGSSYQLAVLRVPDLEIVSRLNMAPHHLPARITWVSDERIVVALAYESGSREAPGLTGEIIALDFDGRRKTTLYSRRSGNSSSAISSASMGRLPSGFASIAGVPKERDGRVYLTIHQGSDRWADGKSMIYTVDSRTGGVTPLGEINRGGMSFVTHEGVARYAYGSNDDARSVLFYREDGNSQWEQLPEASTGKRVIPLQISSDGMTLFSLRSQEGEPEALISSDIRLESIKVLAQDSFASINDIFWTPEPRTPYAVVTRGGRPGVSYLEDNKFAQIHAALSKGLPDHFVDIIGMDRDGGKLLVSTSSDKDPGTVSLFDTSTMNLTSLYRVLPWIDPARMSERRPVRFTSSAGTELDAFLTLPAGSEGRNLPLVLLPHGGPIGPYDRWEYDADAQFLGSRGYAVLQINYRGSGDRGENFERSGYRQFATGIQRDLIDGVEWAIEQGIADRGRVCVFGASFGGYSALMAPITAPDLFKCSINYVGISDYQIWFDRSDTRRFEGGRIYFEQAIGTDKDTVFAVSPINHLDRFNIPVFIVHGEDDQRVPVQNATRLRSALDRAGKPYEWMVKAKEGHGFYSERNRTELYDRLDAFLKRYIGQEARAD